MSTMPPPLNEPLAWPAAADAVDTAIRQARVDNATFGASTIALAEHTAGREATALAYTAYVQAHDGLGGAGALARSGPEGARLYRSILQYWGSMWTLEAFALAEQRRTRFGEKTHSWPMSTEHLPGFAALSPAGQSYVRKVSLLQMAPLRDLEQHAARGQRPVLAPPEVSAHILLAACQLAYRRMALTRYQEAKAAADAPSENALYREARWGMLWYFIERGWGGWRSFAWGGIPQAHHPGAAEPSSDPPTLLKAHMPAVLPTCVTTPGPPEPDQTNAPPVADHTPPPARTPLETLDQLVCACAALANAARREARAIAAALQESGPLGYIVPEPLLVVHGRLRPDTWVPWEIRHHLGWLSNPHQNQVMVCRYRRDYEPGTTTVRQDVLEDMRPFVDCPDLICAAGARFLGPLIQGLHSAVETLGTIT